VLQTTREGLRPGDLLDWNDVLDNWKEAATPFWKSYRKVVAVFALDQGHSNSYNPAENHCYFVLVARDEAADSGKAEAAEPSER